jgi:hypothetical protein
LSGLAVFDQFGQVSESLLRSRRVR